jgi:hypothetical protein
MLHAAIAAMEDVVYLSEQELKRVREMTIGQLLDMLDPLREQDTEENFEFVTKVLVQILYEAAGFYDDRENCIHDFACGVAAAVLNGKPPEHVIETMAGVAYFMLKEEQSKDWSADTRARLERIRDTDEDFAEFAVAKGKASND